MDGLQNKLQVLVDRHGSSNWSGVTVEVSLALLSVLEGLIFLLFRRGFFQDPGIV